MTPGRLGTAARSSRTRARRPGRRSSSAWRLGRAARAARPRATAPSPRRERVAGLARGAASASSIAARQRVAVGQVDALPQRRVGARDARRVAEARPGRRQPLAAQRPRRLADEDVGEHVRQVRDGGHQAVVRLGVDDRRARAEAGDRPVQALEQHPRARRGRRQVPGLVVEEVLAGVLDAGRLAAGQRMAADEALVVAPGDDRALRRADVGHHAGVRRRRPGPRRRVCGQRVDGHGDERGVGAGQRLGQAGARLVERAVRPAPARRADPPRARGRPGAGARPGRSTRR